MAMTWQSVQPKGYSKLHAHSQWMYLKDFPREIIQHCFTYLEKQSWIFTHRTQRRTSPSRAVPDASEGPHVSKWGHLWPLAREWPQMTPQWPQMTHQWPQMTPQWPQMARVTQIPKYAADSVLRSLNALLEAGQDGCMIIASRDQPARLSNDHK